MTQAQDKPALGLRSLPRRQITITLASVLLALFLASLDQTIVSTAMPRVIADLGGFAQYTWLTTAYLVSSTVILPITGKLTDMYGRKIFYVVGISIFVVGSLLCGLSQTMTQIIIFRGLQGIGAGIMLGNAFIVIGDLFPPAERGKYQGYLSATFGLAAIVGPTLGGFITDAFSWHWIFLINLPLGVLTIIAFIFFFPNFRPDNLKHHIDYAGIVTLILAVVPLLLALSWGGVEYPWVSVPVLGLFALAAAAIVSFPIVESRSDEPIVPLEIFRHPVVAVTVPMIFLTGVGMFGTITFVPLYFQGVLGLSATASGSFLTPMMLGQVSGSFISGQILARTGGHYRRQALVGIAIMTAGMWFLSRLTPHTSYGLAVVNVILVGFGLGTTMPLYTIAIQNAIPYNVLGAATSAVPFFRSLGGATGLALFGSVVTNRFAANFLAEIPAALRSAIPPNLLSSLTSDVDVLVSPQAQAQLKTAFAQMGSQGAALYDQTIQILRQALSSALAEVFLLGASLTAFVFVLSFFLKEVPLRKQHTLGQPPTPTGPGPKPHQE